jgi:hypothetical protein
MYNKMWKHDACGHESKGSASAHRFCDKCGKEGVFVGWMPTVLKYMANWTHFFGCWPCGPYRPLANELMGHLWKRCPDCSGGIINCLEDESYRECPKCHALGYLPNCPEEVFLAAKQQLLDKIQADAKQEARIKREREREIKRRAKRIVVVPTLQGGYKFVGEPTCNNPPRNWEQGRQRLLRTMATGFEAYKKFVSKAVASRRSKNYMFYHEGNSSCNECVYMHANGFSCIAFPEGIPDKIYHGQECHFYPYPGDHGFQFKLRLEHHKEPENTGAKEEYNQTALT